MPKAGYPSAGLDFSPRIGYNSTAIGEIPKWSKGPHSKCGSRAIPGQGFESLSLRHERTVILIEIAVLFFLCYDERGKEAEEVSDVLDDDW